MRIATLLVALLALPLAGTATAQTITGQPITTSTIQTKVFNNGGLQGDCNTSAQPWFTFNGVEGGCGESFVLGLSATNVIGRAYNRATTPSVWTPGTIGPSTVFPYPTLTSGVKVTFSRAADNVSVEGNYYSSEANPDFIVHRYTITNTGTTALTNVYPGIYHDFDVAGASAATNLGGYDATTKTAYVYHNTANPYFGVTVIGGTVSGYNFDVNYPPTGQLEEPAADMWTGLTVAAGPVSAARDQRGVIGSGPYTIPAGGSVTVAFATVAGTNQADLLANALAAAAAGTSSSNGGPDGTTALSAPYPNPATSAARLDLSVATSQVVRVTLVDALGREVAVLHDGAVAAGQTVPVSVSTRSLPTGVYLVRAQGETFSDSRRLVLTR